MFKNSLKLMGLLLVLALGSCQEKEINPMAGKAIEEQPYEAQVAYTEKNLRPLGQTFLHLSKHADFRSYFYQALEEQIHGEYSILFEDLVNAGFTKNIEETIAYFVEPATEAFKNIDGKDWKPQLYIPFYEELKEANQHNPKFFSRKNFPVIVLYVASSPSDSYRGYQLDEEGKLQLLDFMIDEDYAKEHEVWVISLSERQFGEKQTENSEDLRYTKSAYIKRMRCKQHKESWAAGASEVNLIAFVSDFAFSNIARMSYAGNLGPYEGVELYKFSRKDVKRERDKEINFYMYNKWEEGYPNSIYGHITIFEYDAWPTATRRAEWFSGGQSYRTDYRSADSPYDTRTLNRNILEATTNFGSDNSEMLWDGLYQ